jgi:non-ribosomal peptide synthase protein (TIGR01720 family)
MTNDHPVRIADLTPDQRELLALRLREVRTRPATDRVPLSFTQEQLWFLDRMEPGTPVYNVPFALRLRGRVDTASLRSAINAVVARQEALRTVFVQHEDGPRQSVLAEMDIPLPVVDLRQVPDARQRADAESAAHGRVSFDLLTGPLLATRLVTLADDEHVLLVTVHHIVFDAWSAEIFTSELIEFYGQLAGGEATNLTALTDSFAQYALRQRAPANKSAVDEQIATWRDRLTGAPATSTLPPDRPRPKVQTHRGGRHTHMLPAPLARRMNELARESGATLNAVALAAFSLALRQATGQDDLLFGMPAAGRPKSALEPLIGSFANMLVLRMDTSGDPAVRELVQRAHRTVGDAYRNQDAPYARVVEAVAPPRDPGINPMFQVLLTVAEAGADERSSAGVVFSPVPVDNQLTDFDLFVTLTRRDDECELSLDYNADLYLTETIEQLADRVAAVLTAMADHPTEPIGAVDTLRRHTIALAATFTPDPAVAPLTFWTDFLRVPAEVRKVSYGQLVPHLLTGWEDTDAAATVGLLRWEDWLRHWDGTGDPAAVLDAAMRDLETAVDGYRRRTQAPLILVRCPISPRSRARGWAGMFARLDDRLAKLLATGVHVEWADDDAGHDDAADDLGHIPYTPEYFAALATLLARPLAARLGAVPGPERQAYIAENLDDAAEVADRAARPVMSTVDDAVKVAPRTVTERRLATLWSDVLGVGEVSVTADFFALGGHSLLATQLLSRLRRDLDREVSLYTLFTNPTIEQLATVLDETDHTAEEPLKPAPADAEPVASPLQQRLWAMAQIDDEDVRHNTTYAAALTGPLDEQALHNAVTEIARRHTVLRTSFTEHRGRPRPVVHDAMPVWCPPLDIADEAAARAHIDEHTAYRYDLATGPLLRVRLLRESSDKHYLLIGMHHIICDNTSWSVFLDELVTLYDAYAAGLPSPLPQPALQFADVAHHQQTWLASTEVESHLAYWREKFDGAPPPVELPGDNPGAATETAGREVRLLPAAAGQAVRELARAEGVTPFSVLLAAYSTLLYQETGQADLVIGVPSTGRDRPELDGVIGCFADMLPLRLDLTGRPPLRRLVRRLHTTVQEAHAHQRLPFAKIVETLRLSRDSAHHPVRCVLNYTDLTDEAPGLPGIEVAALPTPAAGADFDFLFTVDWEGDRLHADLTYRADLYSADRAAELVTAFGELLAELVTNPDRPISTPEITPPPVAAGQTRSVAIASSFPTGRIADTLRFWSELLPEPRSTVALAPEGQVLRPLLDPAFPVADANVVLLRWEDWLAGATPAVPAGVAALELALHDLDAAVSAWHARTRAELVVGVCPASPPFDRRPWTGIFDGLTARLRAFPGVSVVPMDAWARRYGVKESHEGSAYTPALETAVGTAIARITRAQPPVPAVVLEGAETELPRLVRDQLRLGREVIITAKPRSPELAALVAAGAVRVALEAHAPAGSVVLSGEPEHVWALDPTPAGGAPIPADLAADIATGLTTAEQIMAAVTGGFRGSAQRSSGAPRTERERLLAAIFADVLRLDEVGIHDDFYDLGGDSLLAITVAFHAGEVGIELSARQLIRQRTIAELCLDDAATDQAGDREIVEGEVPLTPAQLWFCEIVAPTMSKPAWFNHPYYLELRRPIASDHLREAVRLLAAQHDSLRLRFRRDDDGTWWQHHSDEADAVPFTSHELWGMPADLQDRAMASFAAAEQTALDLTEGPTCRVVHFQIGPRHDRLLIVAHHLVVDAVSRGLLLTDLRTLCAQLERGETPRLPAKTTAYSEWARRLTDAADGARDELPFWLDQAPATETTLPPDNPTGITTLGTSDAVGVTLSVEETVGLHEVSRRLHASVRDLMVWSVAAAVTARTGHGECAIATTGHGRQDLFGDEVTVDRTTGWFQVMYPVLVRTGSAADVAAQLALVPNNGIGHGMLRFAAGDQKVRERLAAMPEPRIAVNYMGGFGFDEVSGAEDLFDVCDAPYGPTDDGVGRWPYDLDVVGTVVGGRLRLDIGYGTDVYRPGTVEAFLATVRAHLLDLLA